MGLTLTFQLLSYEVICPQIYPYKKILVSDRIVKKEIGRDNVGNHLCSNIISDILLYKTYCIYDICLNR